MKKKTSVKKVNFRITKPFSQLKSISALILPGIETVIGNNLSFELFYHIGEVLSSKVFTNRLTKKALNVTITIKVCPYTNPMNTSSKRRFIS